jgi:hypothetical protein
MVPGIGAGVMFDGLAGGGLVSLQPVDMAARATTRIIPISFFMDTFLHQ